MLTNLNQLSIIAKHKTIKMLVVVFPHDHEVMDAVLEAHREGIIKPILIGDEKLI